MSRGGSPSYRRKLERLAAVATEHVEAGGLHYMSIAHDDDCPTLESQSLADCTCEPEFRAPVKVADMVEWREKAEGDGL
jgi:hypothetical protein